MVLYCFDEAGCYREQPAATTGATTPTQKSTVTIQGSVGAGGKNRPDDVKQIQEALNRWGPDEGGPIPQLAVDGIVGPKTLAAIRKFQQRHLGFSDGRVDPGGPTLAKLNERQLHALEDPAGKSASGDPTHNAKVQVGLTLLALASARQCINAALATLDQALTASSGSTGTAGAQAIERCQFHFRHQETAYPRYELYRIREVFDTMARQQLHAADDFDGFFQGKPGTFVPDPAAGRMKKVPFAMAPGGGARIAPPFAFKNPKDPQGPDYETNHIYICVPRGGELPDHHVRLAVHELAHFCGPVDENPDHIPDYAYGWPDSAAYSMRRVTPHQRCRNADSFASFAFHCRYGREWVTQMPTR